MLAGGPERGNRIPYLSGAFRAPVDLSGDPAVL